jgi:hypothetical protein
MALKKNHQSGTKFTYTKVVSFVYGPNEVSFELENQERDSSDAEYIMALSRTRYNIGGDDEDFSIAKISEANNNPIKACYKYIRKKILMYEDHEDV